jgi:hypothetical protein
MQEQKNIRCVLEKRLNCIHDIDNLTIDVSQVVKGMVFCAPFSIEARR